MNEAIELPMKPSVGGMEVCERCGHYQWEHNVDIVVDGKVVRPETKERQGGVCLHNGTIRCCQAFCREFQPGV
jgi:hypothetical protein